MKKTFHSMAQNNCIRLFGANLLDTYSRHLCFAAITIHFVNIETKGRDLKTGFYIGSLFFIYLKKIKHFNFCCFSLWGCVVWAPTGWAGGFQTEVPETSALPWAVLQVLPLSWRIFALLSGLIKQQSIDPQVLLCFFYRSPLLCLYISFISSLKMSCFFRWMLLHVLFLQHPFVCNVCPQSITPTTIFLNSYSVWDDALSVIYSFTAVVVIGCPERSCLWKQWTFFCCCCCCCCVSPIRTYIVQKQAQEQELFPPVKWVCVQSVLIFGHPGSSEKNNHTHKHTHRKVAGSLQAAICGLFVDFHTFFSFLFAFHLFSTTLSLIIAAY